MKTNADEIDYEAVLTVIINGPQPHLALKAFVDQEREHAAHESATGAWVAALRDAAASIYNGAGHPEQEFYDHGVSPWLSARADAIEFAAEVPA